MKIDWSTAPEGFPIWLEDIRPSRRSGDSEDRSSWAKDGEGEYTLSGATSGWWAKSREDHDFIAHQKPAQWTGEGLPPVGMVCEVLNRTFENAEWEMCTVLFLGKHRILYDSESCYERVGNIEDLKFRLVRTPEQIAADKRLHEIRNALTAIKAGQQQVPNDLVRGNIVAATVEAMIDAGYRKQATQ